jgi:neutral ceramidase
MTRAHDQRLLRREFLGRGAAAGAVALGLPAVLARAEGAPARLEVGQGVVDITPPLGIEMAGFHRPPGKERRIKGIRHPVEARALVLKHGDFLAAIISMDEPTVSAAFSAAVARQVAKTVGIPAANVRTCATHTHSMPAFCYLRQWGAMPAEYMAAVEKLAVKAVQRAKEDLAPAELSAGHQRVVGGNFNRTTKTWKTDAEFTKDSTDADRWLDTVLHALVFRRSGKPDLLWYHFSAHPVCYTDDLAGPDWPGIVVDRCRAEKKLSPSYLQGHCGDVNPGDGKPWLGIPEKVAEAVYTGLKGAVDRAKPVKTDRVRMQNAVAQLPLDIPLFQKQLDEYRKDPSKCAGGQWVDAGFAADWAKGAAKWDLKRTTLPVAISALQLGSVGLLFHPGELFSYYGLAIRRDSPFEHTLVVGYTDDIIGYLPDPNSFKAGEYAATVVPKIIDLPPFRPEAAACFSQEGGKLLRAIHG